MELHCNPVSTQEAESTIPITSARDCELPASDTAATPDTILFRRMLEIPNLSARGGGKNE